MTWYTTRLENAHGACIDDCDDVACSGSAPVLALFGPVFLSHSRSPSASDASRFRQVFPLIEGLIARLHASSTLSKSPLLDPGKKTKEATALTSPASFFSPVRLSSPNPVIQKV